jgi:DNA topoisomerase-1
MSNCLQATTRAEITAGGKYIFKASGYTVTFDGFTVLYEEKTEDPEKETAGVLPPLEKDMPLRCKAVAGNQHFTQPPARYTEASLIKALEENGIGRPSTYATTISTILNREYVVREGKALKPTELGEVVTKLMKERFPKVVNVKFTAQVENELDEVQSGKVEWVQAVHDFYDDFAETLKKAKEEMKDVKIHLKEDETDIICEKCGRRMVIKTGRYGKFIACPGYPECKNIKKYVEKNGAKCPKCGGDVVIKHTKKGRIFYGCENYPKCDFVSWNEPTKHLCPKCGKTLLRKKGKTPRYYCVTPDCGYEHLGDDFDETEKPKEKEENK